MTVQSILCLWTGQDTLSQGELIYVIHVPVLSFPINLYFFLLLPFPLYSFPFVQYLYLFTFVTLY